MVIIERQIQKSPLGQVDRIGGVGQEVHSHRESTGISCHEAVPQPGRRSHHRYAHY